MNKLEVVYVGNKSYPTNCYIIYDEYKEAILIDPGFEPEKIIARINKLGVHVRKIIFTHCHADHISAVDEVKSYTKAETLIHENDLDGIENREKACYFHFPGLKVANLKVSEVIPLKDGDNIDVGNIHLKVIHTPGHTSGCICLYEKSMNALFTGDTIFHNCYGRCDLPSSSIEKMGNSLERIFENFSGVIVYPGHEDKANLDDIKKKIRLLYRIKNN